MKKVSIKNNSLAVTVNAAGAELSSLKDAQGSELLWQADKAVWPRHAPVLFPIVGRLRNDSYTYKGKTYTLPQHGFARDKEFTLIGQEEDRVEFELRESAESLVNYPFPFSLRISYKLQHNTLRIGYVVSNPGPEPLPFSIGAHPGFSCKLSDGESLADFTLEFKGAGILTAQKLNGGLLSGETYNLILQNNSLPLNTALFDNDALVFKNAQVEEVILRSRRRSPALRLSCKGWPYFGVWSKKGCGDFICLEPWYGIADAVSASGDLMKKEGILTLEPGRTFAAGFDLELL